MSTKIKRYAVLTPFDKPEVVAGILALQRIDASVVPTQSGALVVRELPVPQYDEWDIRNIVGPDEDEDVDASDNAPSVAAILSRLSKYGVVLIDVDLGSDVGIETGVSGLVRARRFLGGQPGDEVSAGLLLNSVDPLIEKIVLGHEDPADHGAIASSEVTTSMITRLAKKPAGSSDGAKGRLKKGKAKKDRGEEAAPEQPGWPAPDDAPSDAGEQK
ncbi:MAG: hypothetical protein Q3979_00325 [Actinomycetaceae bacterium]|nr:hypothetical protein [Actinomycetaceae bacterium]